MLPCTVCSAVSEPSHTGPTQLIDPQRARYLRQTAAVAIVCNVLLGASKTGFGFLGNSLAVVADGLDSLSDIVTFTITWGAAVLLMRPPSARFPYGHRRAETVATRILSFLMVFVGAQLLVATVQRLFSSAQPPVPETYTVTVSAVSMAVKLGLALFVAERGRRIDSDLLRAGARNMRADFLVSAAVLFGLLISRFRGLGILDTATAAAVSLWIIRSGFQVFRETNAEIMDAFHDRATYYQLFEAIEGIPGVHNPHRARIRKLANLLMIDVDIEVAGERTVDQAHDLAVACESAIRQRIPRVYDIMVHVEPLGNDEQDERFGVNRDNLEADQGS